MADRPPLTDERLNALLTLASDGPWRFAPDRWRGGWRGIEGPGGDVLVLALALGDGGDADIAWIPDDGVAGPDRELIERAPELAQEVRTLRARVAELEAGHAVRLTPSQLARMEAAGWVPGEGAVSEWLVGRAERVAELEAAIRDDRKRRAVLWPVDEEAPDAD